MSDSAAERYVRLGLQLGRHVEGIVDSYFGPPELAAAVEAAAPVEPHVLVADADALLDELGDGWLRDQVAGLRTYAGVSAGESRSYADEVEGCYGVRPTYTDEAVFAAAHARMSELLPGTAPLAERYREWQRSTRVPVDEIEHIAAAVIEQARAWTSGVVELPTEEGVVLEIVRDKPWLGVCAYLGGRRRRLAVKLDLPMTAIELLVLVLHETYPGHHAERCSKEQLLVRDRGLLEETIVMVPTPQSLVAEGIATLAPELLLDSEDGQALAAVVNDAGIDFDLDHAIAIGREHRPCSWAEVNAALRLHDDGESESDVRSYLEHWGLMQPELAGHVVRFLTEPTSRSYIMNYSAGRELCSAYVDDAPDRFRRLLTEQVRVRELVGPEPPGRTGGTSSAPRPQPRSGRAQLAGRVADLPEVAPSDFQRGRCMFSRELGKPMFDGSDDSSRRPGELR